MGLIYDVLNLVQNNDKYCNIKKWSERNDLSHKSSLIRDLRFILHKISGSDTINMLNDIMHQIEKDEEIHRREFHEEYTFYFYLNQIFYTKFYLFIIFREKIFYNHRFKQALTLLSRPFNKFVKQKQKHFFIRPLKESGLKYNQAKILGFQFSKHIWATCMDSRERNKGF